ncbi:MAG: hypothetical protein V5A64_04370 [Candidatus Thermoplasmatota archaeon]
MKKIVIIITIFLLIGSSCLSGCQEKISKPPSEGDTSQDNSTKTSEGSLLSNVNPPSSYHLNISSWEGDNHHLCYLACTSMMLNHYDSDIWFSDVLVYTGAATSFQSKDNSDSNDNEKYEDEEGSSYPSEEDEGEETEGGPLQKGVINNLIIPTVLKNLGFKPHIAVVGEVEGMTSGYYYKIQDREQFSNLTSFFNYLKKAISSGNPVITWFDNSTLWNTYFPSIGIGSEPLVVTGYDENYVYANVATDGKNSTNNSIPVDDFLNGWIGSTPFFIYATKNSSYGKNTTEILSELKPYAEKAPLNLRNCADGLENGTVDLGKLGELGTVATSFGKYSGLRKNLAIFLKEQGYENISAKYNKSASKFAWAYEISDHDDKTPSDVADLLRDIATIEEETYNLWS